MPVSNRNDDYDPHNNEILYEGTQLIINGERDNAPCKPNTRVNNRCKNGIDTTTNIGISRNGSTDILASYNTVRCNTNEALDTDNTSDNTNN